MKTTLTSQALSIALIKYIPQPWTRSIAMHLALARRYYPESGYASCTEDELAAELKVSVRTVRKLKAQIADEGLWILGGGYYSTPSTYTPSKSLIALVRKDAR